LLIAEPLNADDALLDVSRLGIPCEFNDLARLGTSFISHV